MQEGSRGQDWTRKYTRTWLVTSNDANDGPQTILSYASLPVPHQSYVTGNDSDLGARLVNITARRKDPDEDKTLWVVVAEYDSTVEEKDEDPMKRPWEYRGSFEEYTRATVQDIDGNRIQTSSKEDFTPPPQIEVTMPEITITRNESQLGLSLMLEYVNSVNDRAWFGVDEGQAKIKSIAWERVVENTELGDRIYYRKTYIVQFCPDGWELELLDQGLYNTSVNNERRKTLDADRQPITKPVPLDGQGGVLSVEDDPVFLTFNVRKRKDFSRLNLV